MRKILLILLLFIGFNYAQVYGQVTNTFFLVPFYMPETSAGLVFTDILHFKQKDDNFFSALNMFTMYTAKHQFVIGAAPAVYFDSGKYLLEGNAHYTNFLKKYYGVGNASLEEDEEEYTNRNHGFAVSLSRKVFNNLMFGLQYDLRDMTIQNTDSYGQVQYCQTEGVISGIGFKAKFDTRNNNVYPTRGCILRASYLLYNNKFGSKYNFSLVDIDFRNYIQIYKKKVLFSYQIYGELSNGKLPLQSMPFIGGQNLLRGFYSGRYIDNIALAFQPEFKLKITNVIYIALFSGIGNVYSNLEDIDFKKIKLASGAGLRIKIKNNPRINFRIDFAASNESKGTYFTLMEAF